MFFLVCRDVDDIDLFVGLNLEDPVKGGVVGPLTSNFIVEQFVRLRDGDRFFYTHADALTARKIHSSFHLDYLSLSRI